MFRCFLPILILFVGLSSLQAQDKMPVTVSNVNFNSSVGQYRWNNVAIKVRGNFNPDEKAPNKNYVDNVGVRLTIAFLTDRRESVYYFLQSEVEIATLEINKDKEFAFWIPYDIVQRGNFNKQPDYWVIELTVGGQVLPMQKENTSSNISNASELSNFMNKANTESAITEGIMLPGYLAPYLPIDRSPPAFIRKEAKLGAAK